MLKAARARQRILAVFLPVAAVLYIGCEALDPKGTDQLGTRHRRRVARRDLQLDVPARAEPHAGYQCTGHHYRNGPKRTAHWPTTTSPPNPRGHRWTATRPGVLAIGRGPGRVCMRPEQGRAELTGQRRGRTSASGGRMHPGADCAA